MSTTKPTAPSLSAGKGLRQILEQRVLLDAALVTTLADDGAAEAEQADFDAALYEGEAGETSERREVYFIDTNVPGYQELITQVPEGAEVFILDPGSSGLEMMRQALEGLDYQVDAIHLISHGDAGAFRAGYDVFTSTNVHEYAERFADLGQYIATGGDFLIYGCDVAAGESGQAFLDELAGYLGADVAASDDATGPGGDLILELSSGAIQAESWQALSMLEQDLALELLHVGDNTAADGQLGRFMDGDGEWVVAGGWNGGRAIVYRVDGATRTETVINSSYLDNTIGPGQAGWTSAFGRGVSISGDTLVIADPGAANGGRLAIFKLVDGVWDHKQTVIINSVTGYGGGQIGPWESDYSGGQYLAVDGGRIAVGAPSEGGDSGRVFWLADTSGGDWETFNSGQFDEPESLRSDSEERFGASIAIAKDYMIIAAPEADTNGNDGTFGLGDQGNFGRVYVYDWGQSSTSAPTRYTAAFTHLSGQQDVDGVNGGGSVENARLGGGLAMEYYDNTNNGIDDGRYTIVLGAPGEDGNRGEIYIYQTNPGGSIADLASTGAVNIYGQTTGGGADRFGASVAVSQGRLVTGAPLHNATSDTAVWYFEAPNNNWSVITADTNNPASFGILVRTLNPTSPNPTDWGAGWRMGRGLAFTDGNNLAIGGPGGNRVGFFFIRTPVAASDNVSTNEAAGVNVYNILANDIWGTENQATATVQLLAGSQTGEGTFFWNNATRRLEYNTDGLYEYLSQGDTATATITYRITGADGFSTEARVFVTINGQNDAPVVREGI
ncbi:MAG: DUF4347 domain-containing protein, partial [Marinobacter sp.]|nr:DUF4347 domain-containing protein [Marinobacter sp.]